MTPGALSRFTTSTDPHQSGLFDAPQSGFHRGGPGPPPTILINKQACAAYLPKGVLIVPRFLGTAVRGPAGQWPAKGVPCWPAGPLGGRIHFPFLTAPLRSLGGFPPLLHSTRCPWAGRAAQGNNQLRAPIPPPGSLGGARMLKEIPNTRTNHLSPQRHSLASGIGFI